MTAAMAVMLLQAIFVPIVHKTFIKSGAGEKTLSNTLIVRQLLILWGIYIYLKNIYKTAYCHAFRKKRSQLPCIIFAMSADEYPRLLNRAGIFCRSAIDSRS